MLHPIRTFKVVSVAIFLMSLFGCETSLKEIYERSISTTVDAFRELQGEAPASEGEVRLEIKTSIKTPLKGYYLLESKESLHGEPGYPFVLNIDGQAVTWKVDGILDVTPIYNQEGGRTPEGGKGMKYTLNRAIALKPGPHNVFLGLPRENYFIRFDLILPVMKSQLLELRPIYAHSMRRRVGFLYGIVGYEVFLNGGRLASGRPEKE